MRRVETTGEFVDGRVRLTGTGPRVTFAGGNQPVKDEPATILPSADLAALDRVVAAARALADNAIRADLRRGLADALAALDQVERGFTR